MHNSTACFVDSNIELFTSEILPQKKAYIKDIIINIGHKIFNIFIPVLLLMCIQYIFSKTFQDAIKF